MQIIAPPGYTNETSVVWLDDPARHRYLREKVAVSSSRTARPRVKEILVAYAIVSHDTPLLCRRRVWVLHRTDPYEPDYGYRPAEAVDPLSIFPGRRSVSVSYRDAEEVTFR